MVSLTFDAPYWPRLDSDVSVHWATEREPVVDFGLRRATVLAVSTAAADVALRDDHGWQSPTL